MDRGSKYRPSRLVSTSHEFVVGGYLGPSSNTCQTAVMKNFPVVVNFPVRWGEMDALGHVNNTVFFRWFESARIAFFDQTGFPTRPEGELSPILAQTKCDFLKPIIYPADVTIGARVGRIGTSSLVMDYEVEVDGSSVAARGEAVVVLVDWRTGKSHPIPDAVREKIALLGQEGISSSS